MSTATDKAAGPSRERQLVELWIRHGSLGARRSAHDAMALGAQLLLIKSATPHGEFKDRVNSMGLSASTAARYMAVARRFFHLPDAFLDTVATASNLVELLALDDAAVNALARGEEVGGLSGKEVDAATVQSLRTAVREHLRTDAAQAGEPSPARATVSVEEERILRLFRKCDPAGKDALLRVAKAMHKP